MTEFVYALFIAFALAAGYAVIFGPPWWRAALVEVAGGIGVWLIRAGG